MSLARKHKLKVLAQKPTQQGATRELGAYDLMLSQLAAHKRQLKGIQSMKQRAQIKVGFIPDYMDYIQSVIEADKGNQDDVLATIAVWMLDAHQLDESIELFEYAIKHKLIMPGFERSMGALLAEITASYALEEQTVSTELLMKVHEMTRSQDMPDEVRAKLFKAIGISFKDEPDTALKYFELALDYDPKAGVKQMIAATKKAMQS